MLSMLLYNAEQWIRVKAKTIKELEKLQLKQLRVCLAVGKGTPKAHLYAETGTWLIANCILLAKLTFIYHVATLPIGTLTRDLYQSHYEQGLPGLVQEIIPFLEELGVTDITVFSKGQWKKMVKDFLHKKNTEDVTKISRSC